MGLSVESRTNCYGMRKPAVRLSPAAASGARPRGIKFPIRHTILASAGEND